MTTVVVAIAVALVFDVSNGFHDSSNSVAALVATRAARPASAVVLAGAFHLLGPLLAGEAVADTVGSIVHVADGATTVQVAGAALTGALAWNLVTWWRGIPSSSSHALVGGLAGAGLAAVGPAAIDWGHLDGWRPKGVLGVVAALAVSPMLGFAAGFIGNRVARRALRRATRRIDRPIRRAEWVTAAGLAWPCAIEPNSLPFLSASSDRPAPLFWSESSSADCPVTKRSDSDSVIARNVDCPGSCECSASQER